MEKQKIGFNKVVRGIGTYSNVIDTQFSELVQPTVVEEEDLPTVEEFFSLYDQLFYDIPPDGDVNSHKYLIERSQNYIGGSIFDAEKAALIEEINSLRQQLIDLNNSIIITNNLV